MSCWQEESSVLPFPTTSNLEEIAREILFGNKVGFFFSRNFLFLCFFEFATHRCLVVVDGLQDEVTWSLLEPGYLNELFELFARCEESNMVAPLQFIFTIFKHIFVLNDMPVFEVR